MPCVTSKLRPRHLACALAVAIAAPGLALAEPQGAQQALPEPEMRRAEEVRFVLSGVRFTGGSVFSESELQAMAADLVGREVGMGELGGLADRITEAYRNRGYFLSRAVLPVQEVVGGVVEIALLEGVVGEVDVQVGEGVRVPRERITRLLSGLRPGEPLDGRAYERGMLLVSDLPGIRPQSVVQAGRAAGSTDIAVVVEPGRRVSATLEADNHGTRESGRHRIGGGLRVASPLGLGDNLDLRVLAAENANTLFGRVAYEAPVGYQGARLGGGLARVQYELGGAVSILEPTGTANIYDISYTHPVIRQRATNLLLRANLEHKQFSDGLDAVAFRSRKHLTGLGLGWAFEHRDRWAGGGYTSINGVLYQGELDIRDAASRSLDQSIFGRNTHGSFTKLTLQMTRLQRVAGPFNLFVGVGLQETSRNLDPIEKLSLGGPRAVRAYPTGELLVDRGHIVNIEGRWSIGETLTTYAFFDYGRGEPSRDPGPFMPGGSLDLHGAGLGLAWAAPQGIGMNLTLAWPGSGPSVSDDRNPRLFWQIQKRF